MGRLLPSYRGSGAELREPMPTTHRGLQSGAADDRQATLTWPHVLAGNRRHAVPHEKTKSDNDSSTARSAKAQKAEEVQQAGSAKAGAGHPDVPEGGKAEAPIQSKGHPLPAASAAAASGTTVAGTSSATAGKAEKEAAATNAALPKEQHGRGPRKAECPAPLCSRFVC